MLRRNIRKEIIMLPIDITKIEQQARQMRAEEMQRINGLISARLSAYGELLAATLVSGLALVARSVRSLFSWNPQAHRLH